MTVDASGAVGLERALLAWHLSGGYRAFCKLVFTNTLLHARYLAHA